MVEKRKSSGIRIEDADAMFHDIILDKLDDMGDRQTTQEEQLIDIGKTLNQIALQQKDIDSNSKSIRILWKKHDEAFGQNGIVEKIKLHQAGCPKEENKTEFKKVWGAISFTILIGLSFITGIILKLMKVF